MRQVSDGKQAGDGTDCGCGCGTADRGGIGGIGGIGGRLRAMLGR